MYQKCEVIANQTMARGYMRMVLAAEEIAKYGRPGQFVMLKCWEGSYPFLMRPFSINSIDKGTGRLSLLYKVVGSGTELMERMREGDIVRVMGPLGKGFPIEDSARRVALVGRGIGAAPMRYLAEATVAHGIETHIYLSAHSEEQLFDRLLFEQMGAHVVSSTDDRQLVTAHFEKDLAQHAFDAAYTCGSNRLMRDLRRLQQQYGFDAYVSMEEHMACGIGACKGCICSTHDKGKEQYEYVCKDGPVFPLQRIVPA